MKLLDSVAVRALEGHTLFLGAEPVQFERSVLVAGSEGRQRKIPAFSSGQEAIVCKVVFRGKRHALKLLFRPTANRRRRLAFLNSLRLYDHQLPALSAAPLIALSGSLSLPSPGSTADNENKTPRRLVTTGPETKLELLGYLAEYVEGQQLKEAFRVGNTNWDAMSRAVRVRLATQLATAVSVMERCQLAHGDLQPGNIFVSKLDTPNPELRLIDFDAFYHPNADWAPVIPEVEGRVIGFPGYIHPSVHKSQLVCSDRMSLAVLCYEIVALRTEHLRLMNRAGLFRQDDLEAGRDSVPEAVKQLWPAGWELVQETIRASQYREEGATPGDWLNALTAVAEPAPAHSLFRLQVYLPEVPKPCTVAVTKVGGTLAEASPELAWLHFAVDATDTGGPRQLRLHGFMARPPIFRERQGVRTMRREDVSLAVEPGDVLIWKNYKITIEPGDA